MTIILPFHKYYKNCVSLHGFQRRQKPVFVSSVKRSPTFFTKRKLLSKRIKICVGFVILCSKIIKKQLILFKEINFSFTIYISRIEIQIVLTVIQTCEVYLNRFFFHGDLSSNSKMNWEQKKISTDSNLLTLIPQKPWS